MKPMQPYKTNCQRMVTQSILRAMCILGLVLTTMLQTGFAQLRLPAIDPTGRGIFLPQQSTQLLNPYNAGQNQFGVNPLRQNPFGQGQFNQPNLGAPQTQGFQAVPQRAPFNQQIRSQAGPAFQQPPVPPPCDPSEARQVSSKKHLIPDPSGRKTNGQNGQIIMTPSRIVAPVGSEVVVLAGICGDDGFFVQNQPLEWMLSNNSVGELVEVGGMHHPTFNKLIPPTSRKFSGQYAWGRTGLKRAVLTRGTPTPVDDIELAKGQTFASVSSASPGTTYVTAVAPKAEGWDKRRASTIIHWVDGKWSVPAPTRATAGTVHPLTTVVGSTDTGQGLKDWEVRYSIVGGAPAEFAPSGGREATAKTDNNGQATVQIRQPAGQFTPGTTQVRVDIVRPAVFGERELVVESGLTSVTWSAPALTIRAIGPRQAQFDEPFNYRVEITNPGDQVSRNVVVRTKNLDDGIEFISSTPKPTQYGRNYEWSLGDIVPGSAPKVLDVQMRSKKRGNVGMCFEVASAEDRLFTEACAETEITMPSIGFTIEGPQAAQVGQDVTFNLNLENQSDQPLENIKIKVSYDQGLVRPGKSNPAVFELDNNQGDTLLQFGESRSLPITFNVQTPGTRCFDVEITAKGVQPKLERRCVEVGPNSGTGGSGGSVLDGQNNGAVGSSDDPNSPLVMQVSGGPQTEVGRSSLVEVQITNRGNVPLERATLTNRFANSLKPTDVTQEYWENHQLIGNELFLNLGTLSPNETKTVEIRYEGVQVDRNAVTEFTVTTPVGASANQSTRIVVGPQGSMPSQPGANSDSGVDRPDFRDNEGVGIPRDTAPRNPGSAADDLEVRVQTLNPNIRVGEISRVQFSITNNSTQKTLKNVRVGLVVPNSVTFGYLGSDSNVRLMNQFNFFPIQELRAGETVSWIAELRGDRTGQAIFEAQARSDDTFGVSSANDAIFIGQ